MLEKIEPECELCLGWPPQQQWARSLSTEPNKHQGCSTGKPRGWRTLTVWRGDPRPPFSEMINSSNISWRLWRGKDWSHKIYEKKNWLPSEGGRGVRSTHSNEYQFSVVSFKPIRRHTAFFRNKNWPKLLLGPLQQFGCIHDLRNN